MTAGLRRTRKKKIKTKKGPTPSSLTEMLDSMIDRSNHIDKLIDKLRSLIDNAVGEAKLSPAEVKKHEQEMEENNKRSDEIKTIIEICKTQIQDMQILHQQ